MRFKGINKNKSPDEVINRLAGRGDKPPQVNLTIFRVPNEPGGLEFIESIRRYLNRDTYRMRVRGRGKRKGITEARDLKINNAEWLAVYIDMKPKWRMIIEAWRERWT